jgi:hypothetical protein
MRYGRKPFGVALVCAVLGAGCAGGGGWGAGAAEPGSGAERFGLGVRGSFGVSQGVEIEAQLGTTPAGAATTVFVTAGGDSDCEPYDTDPGSSGGEVDAATENRELTLGFRVFPRSEGKALGAYMMGCASYVDVSFEAEGYGESSGSAKGFVLAAGYRHAFPKTSFVGYVEAGVGFWDTPELDLVSGTGDVARYRDRRTALKPVQPHLNMGVLCRW